MAPFYIYNKTLKNPTNITINIIIVIILITLLFMKITSLLLL